MKYRGRMRITFEFLKDLLKLDEDVEITDVLRTDEDTNYDTFTVHVSSKEKTSVTYNVKEGAKIPLSDYRGIYE